MFRDAICPSSNITHNNLKFKEMQGDFELTSSYGGVVWP
jgi:hypothetical protein